MLPFKMQEVCSLVGIPVPPNRTNFEVSCPSCDGKRLNIDLAKHVYNCCRCGSGGGMTKLFAMFTGVPEDKAYGGIMTALGRDNNDRSWEKTYPRTDQTYSLPRELPLAAPDKRDQTYRLFMEQLVLADDHLNSLLKRGLTREESQWLGYKSIPMAGHKIITEQLQMSGCYLKGIPGFFKNDGKWVFKYHKRGILIPVCDLDGRIQGITVRLDEAKTAGKFRWISTSGKEEGCGATIWSHYTGGWNDGDSDIFLTEGPMKADIFYLLTRKPAIAIPGVTAIEEAVKMLLQLKERGLKRVRIALDMDYLDSNRIVNDDGTVFETTSQIYKDYKKIIERITVEGFAYTRVVWPRKYKGIDDYLAARCRNVKPR